MRAPWHVRLRYWIARKVLGDGLTLAYKIHGEVAIPISPKDHNQYLQVIACDRCKAGIHIRGVRCEN